MTKYLNGVEEKAMDIIKELSIFSFNAFEERFFDSYGDKENLFAALKNASDKLREDGRISTAISYECSLNSLKKYTEKNEFSFLNIDVGLLYRTLHRHCFRKKNIIFQMNVLMQVGFKFFQF